jgi:hypothetical protein
MARRFLGALALSLATLSGGAALAQQSTGGDWPCKQVRVPEIALSSVWTGGPIDAERNGWRDDAAVADLVALVAPRRTTLDAAEKRIGDFAAATPPEKRAARLTLLFAGLYERMNDERRQVVQGLDRFGRRLTEMAAKTRAETDAFFTLQRQTPADPEAVKKAAEALQWRVRLFEEQRKMIAYVCESPSLIEQRFGALARKILSQMN